MSTRIAVELTPTRNPADGVPAPRVRWRWLLLTAIVWALGCACAVFFWGYLNHGIHGMDSGAYWLAAHRADPYGAAPGSVNAYLYSPAFATLIWPIAQLPVHVFIDAWMLAEAAAFAWLLRPLGLRWGFPAFCLCLGEVVVGNIYSFLAVVAVVGARWPAAWGLPLLTKITPGLGPIWFAARREWRSFAASVVATVVIAAVSFAVDPGGWFDWVRFLMSNAGDSQLLLPVRFAAAIAVIVYAAVRRRTWLLPVAMLVANPMVFHSEMALSLLAALPRLWPVEPRRTATLSDRRR